MKKFAKEKKNIIIVIGVILIIVFIIAIKIIKSNAGSKIMHIDYKTLEKGELVNSINVKGVVKSVNNEIVYARSGLKILEVNVEVGDKVMSGQRLMLLDTEDLESSIQERKAMLGKQSEANLVQLENAQRQRNEATQNLLTGQDGTLISAKSRAEAAQNSLDNAQKNYDDKNNEHDDKNNEQLINADLVVKNTEIELERKQDDFEKSKILFDSGAISKNEYDVAEQAIVALENLLEDAKKTLINIGISVDSEINGLKQALDTAKINFNDAQKSVKSAERSLSQTIDQYNDTVKSAEVAINSDSDLIAIKNLETNLAKASVISPINGTVTAVYAQEGASASGIMFVVEDVENLKIDTRIKEYDSGRIEEGMEVTIKSDATGDNIYNGKINKIAPTSLKDQSGQIAQTSDVEFETEVKVLSDKTDLKIGMNVKLTIILERKSDIIFVQFDALTEDDEGNDIVYIAKTKADGTTVAEKVLVEILLETDFYAEIQGTGMKEGVIVINNPQGITDGMDIKLTKMEDSN